MDGSEKKLKLNVNKKNVSKVIIAAILAVLVVVVIVVQVVMQMNKATLTTEIAQQDSVVKTVETNMFIVRDEEYISYNGGGNIVSAVKDGARVGVNDTVAYSFADSTSAANVVRMNELETLIAYYNGLSSKSTSTVNDTSQFDDRIMNDLYNMADSFSSGDLSALSDTQNEIRDAITAKQTATGVELNLSSVINSLQSEYNKLKSSTANYNEVKSGGTGYYIAGADGFEKTIAYKDIETVTAKQVEEALTAKAQTVGKDVVGRLVHGYYWYLACVVPTNSISGLKVGNKRTISFPYASIGDIKAVVDRITPDGSTGKSLLVFKCAIMNEDLSELRNETALINIQEYNGYKIDNNAIRVNEDKESGVYVVTGSLIRFKRINIIYSTEDYSIVTNPYKDDVTKSGKYLNLYDEYIIKGTDLYDGKLAK